MRRKTKKSNTFPAGIFHVPHLVNNSMAENANLMRQIFNVDHYTDDHNLYGYKLSLQLP
jgi:Ni,Fe-hydrogenase I large subunit